MKCIECNEDMDPNLTCYFTPQGMKHIHCEKESLKVGVETPNDIRKRWGWEENS